MYVLDTDVVSHLRRPEKAHPNVVAWASSTPVTLHFISAITLHELERGILSMERKDAAQGAVLRAWMGVGLVPEQIPQQRIEEAREEKAKKGAQSGDPPERLD
jgi:toxin FitB